MDFSNKKPHPYKLNQFIPSSESIPGQGYIWATRHNVEAIKDGDYFRVRPVAAEFDLSTKCIYHCPWCAYRDAKESGGIIMQDDCEAEDVVEKLGNAGVRLLVLTGGGEPLLAGHLDHTVALENIVREARRRCMYVILYTNGYLLSRKRSQALLASDISEIRISLNDVSSQSAYEQAHGTKNEGKISVNTVLNNLLDLLREREGTKHKPIVGVSFVLVDSSANNLTQSLSVLESQLNKFTLSIDYTVIRPAVNYWPNDRVDYKKYLTNPDDARKKAEAAQASFTPSLLEGNEMKGPLGTILISSSRFRAMIDEESGSKYSRCLAASTWMNIGPDKIAYLCCETKHMPEYALGSLQSLKKSDKLCSLFDSGIAKYMRETPGSTSKCPTRLCKPAEQNIIFNEIESLRDMQTGTLPSEVIHWLDAMNYWAEQEAGKLSSVSGQYDPHTQKLISSETTR